ncbi:MAG: hypothetical protein LBR22_03100 [Desulfovibrio sp.]|jgi:hypothetical protein|nr:hypothetical protein [Desulfovibrio sp.]
MNIANDDTTLHVALTRVSSRKYHAGLHEQLPRMIICRNESFFQDEILRVNAIVYEPEEDIRESARDDHRYHHDQEPFPIATEQWNENAKKECRPTEADESFSEDTATSEVDDRCHSVPGTKKIKTRLAQKLGANRALA